MELPAYLKTLYRHWPHHQDTSAAMLRAENVCADEVLWRNMEYFIEERMRVWEKKTLGGEPPYTEDPILAMYRFCNIFREFDRQTIEFHTILNPLRDDFPLWLLNMFYLRMVARTETARGVGLLSFSESDNKHFYERLMASARPRYGTPYVFPVSVILKSRTPTREKFIAHYLPSVMNSIAQEVATWDRLSVYEGVHRILPLFGFNLKFLWTEVLIDVAYQYPARVDLFGRFPVGPGSLPTMKRVDSHMDPTCLVAMLAQVPFQTGLTYERTPLLLSAENWEGIGCEFRKYTNLSQGKGRKRKFMREAAGPFGPAARC